MLFKNQSIYRGNSRDWYTNCGVRRASFPINSFGGKLKWTPERDQPAVARL